MSRIIHFYTKEDYTHSSISLDKELDRMYSFGRYNPYNPFWGGFIRESPDTSTFKRFYNTETVIYSLEVTELEPFIESVIPHKKEIIEDCTDIETEQLCKMC